MKTKVNTQTESIFPFLAAGVAIGSLLIMLLNAALLFPHVKETSRLEGIKEGIEEGRKQVVTEAIDYGHAKYHVGRYGGTAWSWNDNCTNAAHGSLVGGWIIRGGSTEYAK